MPIDFSKYIDALRRMVVDMKANFASKNVGEKKSDDELNAYSPQLVKIVVASVIFIVGFALGVIVERSISSPMGDVEMVALNQDETAEDALKNELAEVELDSQPSQPTQSNEAKAEEPAPKVAPALAVASTQGNAKPFNELTAEEQGDVKYLKSSDVWSSSKVKSQRFKNMFTQLNSGNINCLDATFNGYAKEHVNGYVVNVISSIKKLTPEEREKAKKYLREDDGGEIKMSWAAKKIGEMAKN